MTKTREEKLRALKDKKTGTGMTILTDGTPFLEALQSKIDELRKTLAVDVNVDIDDLVEELKHIEAVAPLVKELEKTISQIDLPEEIKLTGLDDLAKLVEAHTKAINSLPEIKLPEANVKVNVEAIGKEAVIEITKQLENVLNVINENANKDLDPRQEASDFIPIRRVRMEGGKLVFDDGSWGGAGGGGGIQPGLLRGEDDSLAIAIVSADGGGIDDSSSIYDGATAVTPKFKTINTTQSGDNDIVTAITGKKIRVLSYAFVSQGTVAVKWQSNTTDLSGPMSFIANTGISAGYNPKGHFETNKEEALQLNLSQAVTLGGHINYIEVD